MNLFLIYIEFFKTGLFAVGGGLAALPFLFQMSDKYEWINHEMIGNFLAIAQSAPGAIGVNMAALTGFHAGAVAGGCLAALGLISPSIIVITIVAGVLKSVKENKTVEAVFSGLRPAAAGLLAAAGFGALKLALINTDTVSWLEMLRVKECIILAVLLPLVRKFKFHPIIYIAVGAAAGIALKL